MRTILIILISVCLSSNAQVISKYPFGGNLNDQIGSNNGTNYGSTFEIGHDSTANHAIGFDGSSYIKLNKLNDLATSLDSFYVGFNFRQDSLDAELSSVFTNINTAGSGQILSIEFHKDGTFEMGKILFYLRDVNGKAVFYYIDIPGAFDNQWHCLAFEALGNTHKAYLDGVEQTKISFTTNSPNSYTTFNHDFVIGARNNRGTIDQHFTGHLDNFIIGKGVLEIDSIYCDDLTTFDTSGDTIPAVICKYPFGGNLNDQVGDNHGTNQGSVYGVGHDGSSNHSICLDGNTYIEITELDALASTLDSFYVAFNFRQDSINAEWSSVFTNLNTAVAGQALSIDFHRHTVYDFGKILFYIRDKDGDVTFYYIDIPEAFDNQWHCLAFETNGTSYKSFLDGVEQTKIDFTTDGPSDYGKFDHPFVIGARNNRGTVDQHFAGCIDNLIVGKGSYQPDSLYCDDIITLGISNIQQELGYKLYPNIVSNSSITLESIKRPEVMKLINSLGQEIDGVEFFSIEQSKYQVRIPQLIQGYYLLEIIFADGSKTTEKLYAN
jgi:hypothetical protein